MDATTPQTADKRLDEIHEIGWFLSDQLVMAHVFYNRGWFFACDDMFAWGCSDLESIKIEDLPDIEKACREAEEAGDDDLEWGWLLWICRKRRMRPQGAVYSSIPESLWPLFNTAGPERVPGPGNPFPNDNSYREARRVVVAEHDGVRVEFPAAPDSESHAQDA